MSETKHTPRQWEVRDGKLSDENGRFLEIFPCTDEDGVNVIADVREWPIAGMMEENAKLIAAAPDLLSIVQEFVKDIDAVGHLQVKKEWPDVADTYGRAIVALGKLTD